MVRKMNVANDDTGDNDTGNHGLFASAEDVFVFAKPRATAEVTSVAAGVLRPTEAIPSNPYRMTTQVLSESPTSPASSKPSLPRKELKSAAELAKMIEVDLVQHPDCPNGFRVTVYGATHWRAMLTITTAAGRVRDPQQWRDLTDELADRLRQRYDLAWA
jgi:hypothetical protein